MRARRKICDPGGRKFSRKIKGFVLGLFGQTIEFLRYLGSHRPPAVSADAQGRETLASKRFADVDFD